MKYLILLFAFVFVSCGSDDNPVNPVTPVVPGFQDSVVKLYSPANSQHFVTGEYITFKWQRNFYNSYRLYFDTSAAFMQENYSVVSDTTFSLSDSVGYESYTLYWKVVPYLRDTLRYEYTSETRHFSTN